MIILKLDKDILNLNLKSCFRKKIFIENDYFIMYFEIVPEY